MSDAVIAKPRFVFFRSVFALMLREMSTTYGRSPGGYVWAFAEPIGGILVMTAVFGMIARTPPLGSNFPLFFATGMLPFVMYQTTSAKVGVAIRYSKPLLSYPGVTYVDAIMARLFLNTLTQVIITVALLVLTAVLFGGEYRVNYLDCARAFAMATALGFGVGVVNCYLMSMFHLWQFIWSVLNRPLFIVSGIFFLLDPLPEHIRSMLLWNPFAHPIMMLRRGIYDTYDAVHVSELYVYAVALVLSALGMLLLHRFHAIILDEGA
ncbi:ABC transporter permease [Pseudoprimorskyibacter insulae]|uniref:Transport permease protein n=1 Tax=Pseudoprimorskyibacter insulae TaxID=1695997 RepID=A0A2R8B0K8_9RHOB|nr:ABC transporter permease [Pseudoprimorskyibacter insulae]SPF81812.1 Polysialic acid transport protein KpsM [Pseudoprimorskyibacter insulae]